MKKTLSRLLLLVSAGTAGCAEMTPALTEAVVNLGRDFIGQTASNYAPDYAQSVNQLLLTMAEITTGAPFASAPGGRYQSHTIYDDPNFNQPSQQGFDQSYSDPGHDPMVDNTGYDPIVQDTQEYDTGSYDPMVDDYGSQPGSAAAGAYGSYGEPIGYTPTNQALSLSADLLAQSFTADGTVILNPISDGEVITDGRGNPAAGDKIKLRFQANCNCYLYIIGVDATGWITQIRPEAGQVAHPLAADQTYLIPPGDEWWGLDEYRGVEHIYFILSQARRPDLEQALAVLPVTRPSPGAGYASVQEPTLLTTRGLVKVRDQAPDASNTPASLNQASASTFSTEILTGDLVVTRWFQHQ